MTCQLYDYLTNNALRELCRTRRDHPDFTNDMLGDVVCVALNRLPARYVRHDVDMMFYLTERERQAIELSIEEALLFAFRFVRERTAKSAA